MIETNRTFVNSHESLGLMLIVSLAILLPGSALAKADWGYVGKTGPDYWAEMGGENNACGGQNQSPVDIHGVVQADLAPIELNYTGPGRQVVNNGHTVQVNFDSGSAIRVDGSEFALLQTHFHAPSENHIGGRSFPLEAHFVHADAEGNLAVIGVMFELGAANPNLEELTSKAPMEMASSATLSKGMHAADFVTSGRDYYRFNGSLTTPPCSEGVRWLVLKEAASISSEQLQKLSAAFPHANNRPLQPLNARLVLE